AEKNAFHRGRNWTVSLDHFPDRREQMSKTRGVRAGWRIANDVPRYRRVRRSAHGHDADAGCAQRGVDTQHARHTVFIIRVPVQESPSAFIAAITSSEMSKFAYTFWTSSRSSKASTKAIKDPACFASVTGR